MKIIRVIIFSYTILIFSCCLACAECLVIVNDSVTQTSLSKEDVMRAFLGKKKKWNDGQKIYLAVLKKGPIHEEFVTTYVNKTPSKFSSFWKIATVSGTGHPPKSFKTEADLLNYVTSKKGALGYISPNTPVEGVKTLSIN